MLPKQDISHRKARVMQKRHHSHSTSRRKVLIALLLGSPFSLASGADWMFQPSYYSHAESPAYTIGLVPQTRSAYRQAYVNLAPHTRISGGWRWNNYQLQNGNSLDNTYMREFYIDGR